MDRITNELVYHRVVDPQPEKADVEITGTYSPKEVDLNLVCGVDNRKRVVSTLGLPYAAICMLLMTGKNGEVHGGTAWLTHSNKLYTAGHNLYDSSEQEWMSSVIVVPAKSGGSEPYGRYVASEFAVTSAWRNNASKRYDLGAIKLSTSVLHSQFLVPEPASADRVSIIGYASVLEHGSFQYELEREVSQHNGQYRYQHDETGGQTGAPLCIDGDRSIGVHNCGAGDYAASALYAEFIDAVENW